MDNYVGKRLDNRYEIQEIIGVGGMSVVYKAYDSVDDRIVAVKILKEEFMSNDDFVRRFKNESKAIALLSHPNIVKVYDVSFGEKLQYIVMECVDGITLKEYIQKQNAITWNDASFFIIQILRALQHAHDKGIVHRDIKPQNIILLSDGSLKVADFGIARFSRSETKTLTDTAIGSVHYISPEQAKGEFTDEKADIYSVGVVLYEMLAGKVPFEADSAVSVALMQLQSDPAKLTEINPDIPFGLEQICAHAMQKDPDDRYQSATEMLVDIEEVIKNPAAVFDYSYFVDKEPTKYVIHEDNQNARAVLTVDNDLDDEEDEEEYYDPKHKSKVITAVVIGLIALIAAIVMVVMHFAGPTGTTKVLDNFIGQSYDDLISTNSDYTFVMQQEKTDEQAPGTIISQIPEAGTKVIVGTQVTLIVAASSDDISVPNVYGLTKEQAEKAFDQKGLKNYKITSIDSDTVEEGKIVYTDPKAESIVAADTQIIVYVSTGPTTAVVERINVPDVVGLKQEGARAFLEKLGFKNINFVTQDNIAPKGVVLGQSPAAGVSTTPDDTIKITISSGVTTTTTKASYKASLSVRLPNIPGETDTLEIELDGKVHSSTNVKLNGKTQNFSVTLDDIENIEIRVSLKNTGAVDTQSVDGKKNQNLIFDFSSFDDDSSDNSTDDSSDDN
ncbi:MAG: Stk1 family PASTA domain-containing Ser/Thr kinase [Clostridium sp.]|nr:Stk1 family PASTA domain-containing Ser/Thr kinase [Clostridium sp.]